MNRRQADRGVGVILAGVLLVGFVSTGQLLVSDDTVMGHAGSAPAIHFLGPLLVSVLVAAVVAGAYAIVRTDAFAADEPVAFDVDERGTGLDAASDDADSTNAASGDGSVAADVSPADPAPASSPADPASSPADPDSTATITRAERRVLDLLPEDERRILEPVIESPGLTQTAVADRADYSRSKVSQTVTDLEERGLLYRERQGRTYRVYPADDLGDRR